MNESPRRDHGVFDFKEEDEIADMATEKQLNKFNNSSLGDQSVLKYEFLGYVSPVDKVIVNDHDGGSIPSVDFDGIRGDFISEKGVSDPTLGPSEAKFDYEEDSELEASQQSKDTSGVGPSPGMSQTDPALSGSPSSNGSVGAISEANECFTDSTPSTPVSGNTENVSLNGCGLNCCIEDSDMDDADLEVVLHPDYIIYQDNYYLGTKLTFTHCGIKINFSTACGKQGASDFDWAIDDVVDIRCNLFQSNETVMMKIRVISSSACLSNNVDRTEGIEELKAVLADSHWSPKHEQITSLNLKYSAVWNVNLGGDMEDDGNNLHEPKFYFPNFDVPFDEVIYPKGDPDAVSLSKRDVDLLQPDTFINDTIIDFYIKYLKNQIKDEEKHRFHFFNSFFFRKLADMDKNPSSASDGKAAFLRVRKWTRKVNLFEKDYIFIPVNFNLHWSLLVICHPGEAVTFNEECLDESLKVPCILHMDSIKGSHSGLQNLVRSYLLEEWKERQKDKWDEDLKSKFLNMRFLPLALPQQENSYDCGLFLLHYLELFLAEIPENFNPLKLTKFSNFLNMHWFPPAEAYLKRTLIQRLIFELLKDRCNVSASEYSDGPHDVHYLGNNENRTGVQCLEKGYNSAGINGLPTTSHAAEGIEITLLSSSSSLDPNSGVVLRELFEPGATAELLEQCQSFDHRSSDYRLNNPMFPIEEDTEKQFMYLTTHANYQQVAAISPRTSELPYLSRGSGTEICHQSGINRQAEDDKTGPSHVASDCASDDSDDVGVIENFSVRNEVGSFEEDKPDENNYSSMGNPYGLTEITGSANLSTSIVVESSRDSDVINNSDKDGILHLHQVSDKVDELPYLSRGSGTEICHQSGINRQAEDDKTGPSHVASDCASDDSDDVGVIENFSVRNEVGSFEEDKPDENNYSSMGNPYGLTEITGSANLSTSIVVESSRDSDVINNSDKDGILHLHQVSDKVDEKVTGDGRMTDEFCEEQGAKRRRLMSLECESSALPKMCIVLLLFTGSSVNQCALPKWAALATWADDVLIQNADFSYFIRTCEVVEAELWAIYKGLQLAWDLGLKNVTLETDAQNLIPLIQRNDDSALDSLLSWQIQNLLARPWRVEIQYFKRKE
ncbi:probable ubiquitin-like-specific protease 2B [Neltuma alba]|uniref:probable ubiquitin-like-specific protease 2B n=1 Tax=Neltuma alba TaxID=207710 RepID=UPI0010A47DD2|nr:probable ubiquitin-like-specific protease 2B [Prosopis alba]